MKEASVRTDMSPWLRSKSLTPVLIIIGLLLILLGKEHFRTTLYRSQLNSSVNHGFPINQTREVKCEPGVPCSYPETVDFRIIVLTFNRAKSLQILLNSLDTVELDGSTGRLEIWIDRNKKDEVDIATVQVATSFQWKKGPTRVHIQKRHVGIYGQWIDTWAPTNHSKESMEIALFLEDDISVSPYVYRWLKAVHAHYRFYPEFFGASLVSDEPGGVSYRRQKIFDVREHTVFWYKFGGTWGTSPAPSYWHDFQNWYHNIAKNRPEFRPYIPDTVLTRWYKKFESVGTADRMWSMWMAYYMYKEQLFSIYNNLELYNNNRNSCLVINRREVGLHYKANKKRIPYCTLLNHWSNAYVKFPNKTLKVDYNGNKVPL